MLFQATQIDGAFVLVPERRSDARGYFARLFCDRELEAHGLCGTIRQINTSFSPRTGTLRGLHYQAAPYSEAKTVRCVRGAAYDVIVDLRPDSPTFRKWYGVELTAENGLLLHAPDGTAHGYLTLAPDTELIYATSQPYAPEAATGVRYDDPAFGIVWPGEVQVISAADQSWRPF